MNRLLSFLEYRPRLRNILSFCFSLIVMLLIGVGKVTAQDSNNSTLDLVANLWMLIAGSLVFFMNAGFAMLETGFGRTNNATNVLAKNLIVFCVSALAYWMFGFGLMFGDTSALENSFSGGTGFFLEILTPNNQYSQFQKLWPGRSSVVTQFSLKTFL
jgi:Amt family ammonium transporter